MESGMLETKNIAKRNGKIVYADGSEEILEYGMTEVGEEAFMGKDIVSAELPNSVHTVGACAFFVCSSLKKVVIPYSVKTIERRAFSACDIEEITIPYGVEVIGESAFSGCEKLHTVHLTKGLKEIEEHAFYECKNLKKITLPEGLVKIGREAFSFCREIETEIPKSVTEMGANPFRCCRNCCVSISAENAAYKLIDGNIYTADGKEIISYLGDERVFSVPEGTERIGEMAFSYSLLNEIKFAESVRNIGRFAFWGCRFSSLTIPWNVYSIGELAFSDCKSLRSIYIEEGVCRIEKRAFDGCELLTSAYLPKTLDEVEDGVFDGCAVTVYKMDIFYGGSKLQWNKLKGRQTLETAKIHYKTVFGYTK